MLVKKHSDKQGLITGRIHPRAFDAARQMPGRRKWKERNLYFELSAANVEFLEEFMGDLLEWDPSMKTYWKSIQKQRQLERETIEKKKQDVVDIKNFPFKTKPMDHQLRAFSLARGKNAFGYLMEQGTGKSKTVMDDAADLYMEGSIDLLLITAPNGVHVQWVREQLPLHFPEVVPYKAAIYTSSMSMRQKGEFEETLFCPDVLRILAVNIESLSHKSGFQTVEKILSSGSKPMWILDESSRIKNPSSKRTRACISLSKYAKFRRILSGTPITKGVEDLYSQLCFLDEDILGHRSYYTFRNEYCVMGGFENKQVVDYKNVEKLTTRLEGHTFRATKEECLDLPPVLHTSREVPMTDEQKKLYNRLRDDFILALDSGEFQSVPLGITRLVRFQQILAGHVPNMDMTEESDELNGQFSRIKTLRPQAILEVLEETEGKTIVWTKFRMDELILGEALEKAGVKYKRYQANMTEEEKWKAKGDFETDSSKVLLASPRVAGIGLNLTAARNCIWYGLPLDMEIYKQANDRIDRMGQLHAMTNVHLSTAGTVDSKLYSLLKKKSFLADSVLDHNKNERFAQGQEFFGSLHDIREAVLGD